MAGKDTSSAPSDLKWATGGPFSFRKEIHARCNLTKNGGLVNYRQRSQIRNLQSSKPFGRSCKTAGGMSDYTPRLDGVLTQGKSIIDSRY